MKMTEEKQTEEEQHIDLRKIRETFAKDRFATENGAIIEEEGSIMRGAVLN